MRLWGVRMTNREKLIKNINEYCRINETDAVQGSAHFFLSDLSEYENKILLKEMHGSIIMYDEPPNRVTQLAPCRNYFSDKAKKKKASIWTFVKWVLVWASGILSALLVQFLLRVLCLA